MKTVAADSMVKTLTDAAYVPGEQGAPYLREASRTLSKSRRKRASADPPCGRAPPSHARGPHRPLVANLLASIIAKGLPTGLEFGRFSIDYHYLRNALFVESRMGKRRAARHVPAYAKALMARYDDEMRPLREAAAARASGEPAAPPAPRGQANGGGGPLEEAVAWLALLGLLI